MKILIISDTHGRIQNALCAISRVRPERVYHLGDTTDDAGEIGLYFPDIEVCAVKGNNDFFSKAPDDIVARIDGLLYFFTHGHKYGVKTGLYRLAERAKALGADIAVFGHTHRLFDGSINGVRLLNPSSSGYIVIDNNQTEVNKY
ncbi:MAG: hypothetical protein BWY15_00769 [Firmicutes bacterium ADurb.Bin193]|nr:MAG: hypothetical protein BWY15_00769 [Firmicutes bacterium ADurb.Bin193]